MVSSSHGKRGARDVGKLDTQRRHRRAFFEALEQRAMLTVAYEVPLGTLGNQAHGGPLGMDFDVNQEIAITRLGVFDDGGDGLNVPITAVLYDRTTEMPVASLVFAAGNTGTLEGGSRFLDLPAPLLLSAGFQGTIVAYGYGATEQNGNSATPPWTTNDGGGVLSFVGQSRFEFDPNNYPAFLDGGPANRYAAGTFAFVDTSPTINLGSGPNEVVVTLNGSNLEIIQDGVVVFSHLATQVTSLGLVGGPDNDTLTIDYSNGFFPIPIDYSGAGQTSSPGDTLRVIGSGTETATYLPDPGVFGAGRIQVDSATIQFTGLEPVDIVGMATALVQFPNGAELVTVEDGQTFGGGGLPAILVSGTSGGVPFETVALRNNANVVIDTVTGGFDGIDEVVINTVGGTNNGNGNLTITTGAGVVDLVQINGTVTVQGDLTVSSQQIQLNMGASLQAANVTLDAGGGFITDGDPGAIDVSTPGTLNVSAAGGVDLDIVAGTLISNTSTSNGSQTFSQLVGSVNVQSLNAGAGAITLDQGTFNLAGPGAIADTSTVIVNTPGVLSLNGFDETIANLSGTGVVNLTGSQLTVGGNNAAVTFTGTLQGTVSATLNKVGSGTFNLNALASTAGYLGSWIVDGGVLVIDSEGRLGPVPGVFTPDYITLAGGGTLSTTGTFALSSNRGFTLGPGGGQIEVAPGTGLNVNGAFSGGTGLTKLGSGDLILLSSAVLSNFGPITATAGRLFFSSQNALGTGPISINSGATLDYLGGVALPLANTVTIASGGAVATRFAPLTLSAATVLPTSGTVIFNLDDQPTSTLNIQGGVALTGDLTIQVGGGNPVVGAVVVEGVISGSGGIIQTGSTGTLVFTGNNTYNGTTSITQGIFGAASNNALGSAVGGTIVSNGAMLAIAANYTTAEPLTLSGTGVGGQGAFQAVAAIPSSFAGPITLAVNSAIGATLGSSLLLTGPISGAFDLTKVDTGVVVLAGSNTYGGATLVNAGTLRVQGGNAIPDGSAVSLANAVGVVLDVNGSSETIGSLAGGGAVGGTVSLGTGTLTVGANNASTLFSGAITGLGGNLTKVGTGTFELAVQDVPGSYTGTTTVNGGTLVVTTVIHSAVTVNAGGTLAGTGEVDGSISVVGGNVSPGTSPGVLDVGDTVFAGGTFTVEIGGPTAGDGAGFHDQLNVTGTVNLGGATLSVTSFGGYVPVGGDAYIIVRNDLADPVTGTFAGLPEGAIISANFLGSGLTARITYMGGDGNDATIVVDGDVVYNGDATAEAFELREVAAGGGLIQLLRNGLIIDSRPTISVASFTVNGGDGNDSLLVNYGGSGGYFDFPVTFNGEGQTSAPGDTLLVGGNSATTVEHTFVSASSGQIAIDGRLITYTGLEPIVDNMVAANRIFTFTGAAETITLSDDGVAANEQSRIDSTLGEVVTFTNATNSLTINLTNGADILNVQGLDSLEPAAAPYSADLMITQDGGDTINFQVAPTNLGAGNLNAAALSINFSATVTTTGDVVLNAVGAITTANAGLDIVADDLTVTAGSGVDLDTTVATLNATVSAAGNLTIDETDALNLTGLVVAAGNASVLVGGALTDAPGTTLNVSGNANFAGTSIVLGDNAGDSTNFGSLTFNSVGPVVVTEDSATSLSGTSTAASLVLTSAGALTDAAVTGITVTGNASLNASSITLGDSVGDVTNFGSLTFNSAGGVTVFEDSATVITGLNTAVTLTLSSAGALTDAAGTSLTVTGNATLAGTSITLGDNGADTVNFGSLTFTSAGAVVIDEDSATVIAGVSTAASLALVSAGDITDAAVTSINVTGNAVLTGGSITLGDVIGDTTNFGSLTFTSSGSVTIVEDSGMSLVGASSATGAISLTSADTLAGGEVISLGAGATISSTTSGVVLNGGDGITVTGNITTATNVALAVDQGAADPGVGAVVTITGIITAPLGTTISGGADNDVFNLAPQPTTSFDIDGGAPVLPVLPGDVLNLDLANVAPGNATLVLGMSAGSGTYTFAAPETEQSVTFVSIETNNVLNGDYHLVLDMAVSGFEDGVADTVDIRRNGANLELRVNGPVFFTGGAATIRSLTVIGSDDNETFTVTETVSGLPSFIAAAPPVNNTGIGGGISAGSHLNATADAFYVPETVANVTMHFVGGAGINGVAFDFLASHDVGYFSDTVGAANSGNVGVQAVGGGPAQALVSFVGAQTLNLDGAGGNLTVDASSSPATAAITIDSPVPGITSIVGDVNVATTTFNTFNSLLVRGGNGAETITLVAISGPPLTSVTLSGSNLAGTDIGADVIRVRSLPVGVTANLIGGLGNDRFELGNLANTVNAILGQVIVDGTDGNVVSQVDTLLIIDSGDVVGATVTITESQVDGLTGFAGVDVLYSNVDVLDVTTTDGGDTINATFVAGSDLNSAIINGAGGEDQFFLTLPDTDPVLGTPSGLTSVSLNGNAGNDTFGSLAGPRIMPSRTTAISINGGPPTLGIPPVGDTIGDILNVDISLLPTTFPVFVTTIPGTITTVGYAPFSFVDIEDINLFDFGALTDVEMGDIYLRTTEFKDRIIYHHSPTLTDPDRFRVTINTPVLNTVFYATVTGSLFASSLGGDDELQNYSSRRAVFDGGDGADYIAGGSGPDLLIGGLGPDQIVAGLGDDEIWGDEYPSDANPTPQDSADGGHDRISGGAGSDVIYGGGGNDRISGDDADDYIHAGQGDDTADGGFGNDRIYGGPGRDLLTGYFGNDLLVGGAGLDRLYGQGGNDILIGGVDSDELYGEDDNDLLISGSVSNEQSSLVGDANDLALAALLATWGATGSDRTGLGVITQDGVADLVRGKGGNDDFSVELIDYTPDFNGFGLGNDEKF